MVYNLRRASTRAITVFLLVIALAFSGAAFSGCASKDKTPPEYKAPYATSARQGYYGEIIGTAERHTPILSDGGLECGYPEYGTKLKLTAEQKRAITAENVAMCANATNTGGSYDKMDADGYLYLSDGTPVKDSAGNNRRLYRHTAADGMYYGNVSNVEPAVVKRITFTPRAYSSSYGVTGLYAPAGEVVKIEMSAADMTATGGVTVHIGQALYNGQNNNIWDARDFVRMPMIMNTMSFTAQNSEYDEANDKYTCYVGSYLGGPIYVRNTNSRVTLTISGAVRYRHFILGQTTEEEFKELSKCTAPYFDLEVWENGILISGPLKYAEKFTYDQLYDAATLWEKISLVSTRVRSQGIVSIFDPFVAAGAAVAFPGRASTNCPVSWMPSALDSDEIIKSGAWGVLHEYNHNFQNWGLPGGGEVTNNALTLAEYSLFTEISAARTMSEFGEGGLSGWNTYTNSSKVLRQVLDGDYASTNQLAVYAALIHNIGAENFVRATNANGVDAYYKRLTEVTGYDMTYYFRDLISQEPSAVAIEEVAAKGLKPFVPVACVYQTGRSVRAADGTKSYIESMRPFGIPFGKAIDIDLNAYTTENGSYKSGSVVLPQGFTYKIKKVTKPSSGKFVKKSNGVYTYTPGKAARSGKIFVTLGIEKSDGKFTVDDIELVLEFEQTKEINKSLLERTVYTYDALPYASAADAYENNYDGAAEVKNEDNVNPTQNGNAEIWAPNPNNNAVMEVRGKIYVPTDGDYRIALRGRYSCALYISTDGGRTFSAAARLDHKTQYNGFWQDDPNSYADLRGLSAGSWVYFKEVLLVNSDRAFVGLGWGMFQSVQGTYNEDGVFVDGDGNPIDENAPPTVTLAYANAYRNSYEFETGKFVSRKVFEREYAATYDGSVYYEQKGTLVKSEGYTEWKGSGYSATLDELFDSDDTNFIHSAKGAENDITPSNPFDITVDLGVEVYANTMTVYGEPSRQYQPKTFELYGGTSADSMQKIVSVTDAPKTGSDIEVAFTARKLRYYRLVVTSTYADSNPTGAKYIAYRRIGFARKFVLENGRSYAPENAKYYGKWNAVRAVSRFGRAYEGRKNAYARFEFSGKRFAVFTTSPRDGLFKVYIDGKLTGSAETVDAAGGTGLTYLSPELKNGKHKVKIVCAAPCGIDSYAVW